MWLFEALFPSLLHPSKNSYETKLNQIRNQIQLGTYELEHNHFLKLMPIPSSVKEHSKELKELV